MSLGGEVASRGLQALLKGPGAKLAQEGGMKQVREMARATDQKLGTDLLGKAPVDVRTASPFMGAMAQSRRMAFETQEPMRKADEPFLREMEKALDQFIDRAGAAPPAPKDGQIYAVGLGERAAEAIEGTTRERLAKRSQLYADFEKVIDPTTPVQRTEIDAALNSIENTNVFNREGTVGTKGLNKLVEAMDNARSAQTFADVSRISEQLYDEIDAATGSATPLFAPGVLSQMRTLASALHKTEMDFLRSGGGTNSPQAYDLGRRAADYAKDLFALNESSGMRKVLRDPELRSQIPKSLFDNLSAEQIIAFKRSIGQEGTSGGLQVNEQGQKVFAEMLGDFFSRLRQQASVSTDQRRQGMFPQDLQKSISGKQINDTLDRIEKSRPGAVEALLGKRVEGELRQLANTLQQLTQSERSIGNYPNTARYNMLEGGLSSDLLDALTGVFKQGSGTRDALARIAARALRDVVLKEMTTRPGVGRYFLGETALQQAIPNNLLRAIGRTGGQVGIRQLGDN